MNHKSIFINKPIDNPLHFFWSFLDVIFTSVNTDPDRFTYLKLGNKHINKIIFMHISYQSLSNLKSVLLFYHCFFHSNFTYAIFLIHFFNSFFWLDLIFVEENFFFATCAKYFFTHTYFCHIKTFWRARINNWVVIVQIIIARSQQLLLKANKRKSWCDRCGAKIFFGTIASALIQFSNTNYLRQRQEEHKFFQEGNSYTFYLKLLKIVLITALYNSFFAYFVFETECKKKNFDFQNNRKYNNPQNQKL